jgi:hypothetical protein
MKKETRSTASGDQNAPLGSFPARWIVCERTGRWATGLRRVSAPAAPRIRETRSLADAWILVDKYPGSFLVLELTAANAEALFGRLLALPRDFPRARWAVVAERSLAEHEWLVRELGADWFAVSPRDLAPVAEIARRHLALAQSPRGKTVEEIWNRLPWAKHEE